MERVDHLPLFSGSSIPIAFHVEPGPGDLWLRHRRGWSWRPRSRRPPLLSPPHFLSHTDTCVLVKVVCTKHHPSWTRICYFKWWRPPTTISLPRLGITLWPPGRAPPGLSHSQQCDNLHRQKYLLYMSVYFSTSVVEGVQTISMFARINVQSIETGYWLQFRVIFKTPI